MWSALALAGKLSRSSPRRLVALREFSKASFVVSEAVKNAFTPRGGAGMLSSETVSRLCGDIGCSIDEVMLEILPHAKQAAVPQMSDYQVGAVALGSSGCLYLGFNLELRGKSFQHTVHAEQSAIYLAADAEEKSLIKLATSATPCGHCRQFMQELPSPSELQIICPEQDTKTLGELLPHPFGPQHLGFQSNLLQRPHHILETLLTDVWGHALDEGQSELRDAALTAARRSYAPFGAPSGMAVRMRNGEVYSGFAVQSVAHNPGMTTAGPLQGILVKLVASGYKDWNNISEAILVETVNEAGILIHDYEEQVRCALKILAPDAFGSEDQSRLHVIRATSRA